MLYVKRGGLDVDPCHASCNRLLLPSREACTLHEQRLACAAQQDWLHRVV